MKFVTIGYENYLFHMLDKCELETKTKRNNYKKKLAKQTFDEIVNLLQYSEYKNDFKEINFTLENNELVINIAYETVYYSNNFKETVFQIINQYLEDKFGYHDNIRRVVCFCHNSYSCII